MRYIAILVFVLSNFTIASAEGPTDWSGRIVSTNEFRGDNGKWPDVGLVKMLIVDGRRFEHIRGENDLYLKVPNTDLIVFVEEMPHYLIKYHIINMTSRKDITISARGTLFGYTIGATHSRESVEIEGGNHVILCVKLSVNDSPSAKIADPSLADLYFVKSLYDLDLNKQIVAVERTLYLDKAGKLLQEHDFSPPPLKND